METNCLETVPAHLLDTCIFNCAKCHKLLQPPVMLTEDVGDICNPCYTELYQNADHIVVLNNKALDKLLQQMLWYCEYQSEGCQERLHIEALRLHESACPYKSVTCESIPNCDWSGCLSDYVFHFEDHYRDETLTAIDDIFEIFEWKNTNVMKILKPTCGLFVVHIRSMEDDKVKFLIYEVGGIPAWMTYTFYIEFVTEKQEKYTLKYNNVIKGKTKLVFDENLAIDVSRDLLNNISQENIKLQLVLDTEDGLVKRKNNFVSMLKCVKCQTYVNPPVNRCINYHYSCQLCSEDNKCSKCKLNLKHIKELDNWVEHAEYICLQNECDSNLLTNTVHESSLCIYHKWNCPCCDIVTENYTRLLSHFKLDHESQIIGHNTEYNQAIGYILIYNRLFCLTRTRNFKKKTVVFRMNYIGPKVNLYKFQIEFMKDGCLITSNSGWNYTHKQTEVTFPTQICDLIYNDYWKTRIIEKK